MKKHASLAIIAATCAALFAVPALAQSSTGGGNMAGMKMSHAPKKRMKMAKAGGMKLTCMDYAWQSQDEKDCEAGKIKPPNWR